jgi:hypothetical protein
MLRLCEGEIGGCFNIRINIGKGRSFNSRMEINFNHGIGEYVNRVIGIMGHVYRFVEG